MKRVSISDLKRNFHKLLMDLQNNENLELVVTINNRPMAVIISWKRYRALRETLALAESDEESRIQKVIEDSKHGHWMTSEELKKNLGLPLTAKEEENLKKFQKSGKYRRREKLKLGRPLTRTECKMLKKARNDIKNRRLKKL